MKTVPPKSTEPRPVAAGRFAQMKPVLKWLRCKKPLLLGCGIGGLVCVGACAFLRISNLSDVLSYYGMFRNHHPILTDLAFHRFNQGDSLSDFVRRYPTNGADMYGHYSNCGGDNLSWSNPGDHTSVEIIAKDGKLIYAEAWGSVRGVPWEFTFFHTTNDAEMLHQFDQACTAMIKTRTLPISQKP